jgi:hypothetical protein
MNNRNGLRQRLLPWAWITGLAFVAWTATARAETYLIISLIGDHLTIVTPMQSVGSHGDTNKYETVPLGNSELDDFAVRTAGAVVGKVRPTDKVEMLRAVDPTLRKMSGSWLDAGSINVQALVTLVADLFKPPSDSHLLLIAPLRGELELKTQQDYRGQGKAAGLGFYVDGATRLTSSETGEMGTGFLGIFANFQLLLVSIHDGRLEGQQRAVAGTTIAAARAADKNPWNALAAPQKIAALQFLIKGEIERVLPGMLGSPMK